MNDNKKCSLHGKLNTQSEWGQEECFYEHYGEPGYLPQWEGEKNILALFQVFYPEHDWYNETSRVFRKQIYENITEAVVQLFQQSLSTNGKPKNPVVFWSISLDVSTCFQYT